MPRRLPGGAGAIGWYTRVSLRPGDGLRVVQGPFLREHPVRSVMDVITLPRADDLHVHLRQDELLRLVTPLVWGGGVGRCLVMPNTRLPVTSVAAACAYRDELRSIEPRVEFLMTLYLTAALTADEVRRAADAGIVGVKCYPQGVTTHSDSGIEDLARYDSVFAAMEEVGLVLELHGEVPSDPSRDICILNAEQRFLPELERLHRSFPRLRLVLEHVTTSEAVACVRRLGATVAATITAHHLELCADDWAGRNHNFCKPVAKFPHDRAALRDAVREGHPRFFLGSDSAPHPRTAKEAPAACAGIFTTPLLLAHLATTFDSLGCLECLAGFASGHGRTFYGLAEAPDTVRLERHDQVVPQAYGDVVPFRAGEPLHWRVAGGR
ncbi:MAG: dihydroorotase [Planctomycetota bacterium]